MAKDCPLHDDIRKKEDSLYLCGCLDELAQSHSRYKEALYYRYYLAAPNVKWHSFSTSQKATAGL